MQTQGVQTQYQASREKSQPINTEESEISDKGVTEAFNPTLPLFRDGINNAKRFELISLLSFRELIRTGDGKKELFEKIRTEQDKDKRAELKSVLAYTCASGLLGNSRNSRGSLRHNANVVQHTGLIQCDFDTIPRSQIIQVRNGLEKLPYIAMVFLGPSATLKAFARVTPSISAHKNTWRALKDEFKGLFGFEIDKKAKTLSMPCYISFDPEVFLREHPTIFRPSFPIGDEERKPKKPPLTKKGSTIFNPTSGNTIAGQWKPINVLKKLGNFPEIVKSSILSALIERRENDSGEHIADCPNCGKSSSEWKFSYNPNTESYKYGAAHCFSCDKGWSGFGLAYALGIISENGCLFVPDELPELNKIQRERIRFDGAPNFVYRNPELGTPVFGKSIEYSNKRKPNGKLKKLVKWFHFFEGDWYYGLFKNQVRFLYGIERIQAKSKIFLLEGERKTESLNNLFTNLGYDDYAAISLPHGKISRIHAKNLPYLTGKSIYICPDYDHDKGGQRCAIANYSYLNGRNLDVHIMIFSSLSKYPHGFDFENQIALWQSQGLSNQEIAFEIRVLTTSCSSESDSDFIRKFGFQKIHNEHWRFETNFVGQAIRPDLIQNSFCIESPYGTGKTSFAKDWASRFQTLIVLTHRQTLSMKLAKDFQAENYLDLRVEKKNRKSAGQSIDDFIEFYPFHERIVISIDSLPKLDVRQYNDAAIVIDEVDQVVSHVFNDTCKQKRLEIISNLDHLIKHSRSILALSADIPDYVHSFLAISGKNLQYFHNEWKNILPAVEYDSSVSIINNLRAAFASNVKIAVACAEKRMVDRLKLLLQSKDQKVSKKILCITADNSKDDDIQELILNPLLFQAFDAVIYSPAIFTGVDFNIDGFEQVFLIAKSNGGVTATDLVQGAFRFRKISKLHYFINRIPLNMETDLEKLKEQAEHQYNTARLSVNLEADCLFNATGDMDRPICANPKFENWVNLYFKVLSDHNQQYRNLNAHFRSTLSRRGGIIELVAEEQDEELKEDLKNINAILREQDWDGILNAKDIHIAEYNHLTGKKDRNLEEEFQVKRYQLVKANGGVEELEKAFKIGPYKLFRDAWNLTQVLRENAKSRIDFDKFGPDIDYRPYHNLIRKKILGWPVMERLMNGGQVSKKDYPELIEAITTSQKFIRHIGLTPSKIQLRFNPENQRMEEVQNPIVFVRHFFEQFGFLLARSGANSNRRYSLDQDSVQFMQRVLTRKEEWKRMRRIPDRVAEQ